MKVEAPSTQVVEASSWAPVVTWLPGGLVSVPLEFQRVRELETAPVTVAELVSRPQTESHAARKTAHGKGTTLMN